MAKQKIKDRKQVKLGDVVKVISGFAFKSEDFSDKGIPVIKIKNIRVGYVDIEEDTSFVNTKFMNIDKKYHVNNGDILISLTGSHISQWASVVGRVGFYRKEKTSLLNQRAGKIIINEGKADRCFLYFLLFSDEIRYRIASLSNGAASQANISPSDVESLEILLPPLPTQQKIASILSSYDDLIENNTRRIKILEEQAQLIYKEWFVKFKFPGWKSVKMVDSGTEFGEMPEGWEVKILGEVFDIKYGKTLPKTKISNNGEYPVYGAGGIIGYYNEFNEKEKVALVTCRGNGSGTISRTRETSFITNNSFIIKPKEKYSNMKYFYVIQNLKYVNIDGAISGSAQPQITIEGVSPLKVLVPEEETTKKYCQVCESIYEGIDYLFSQNQNLKETRDMLIPKLVSGEVEV